MVETRVEARSLRVGDRVVFKDPQTERKVARELLHIEDNDGDLTLEFQSGRGRFRYTVAKDAEVLVATRHRGTGRYVLA